MTTTTNYVNLTPHTIRLFSGDTVVREIEPSGTVCRIVDRDAGRLAGTLDGFPVGLPSPLASRELVGLPDPKPGTVYLASVLCLDAARDLGRADMLAPDTDGGAVRDESGWLIGTRRLLAAADPCPDVAVLFGSATHPLANTRRHARDLDVIHTPGCDLAQIAKIARRESLSNGPLDANVGTPTRKGEDWEISYPVWGEDDPSAGYTQAHAQGRLIYASPTWRPIHVRYSVRHTGPARLRRFAATGEPFGSVSGSLSIHLTNDRQVTGGYHGDGLAAWESAAAKIVDTGSGLPEPVREVLAHLPRLRQLLECGAVGRWAKARTDNQAGAGTAPHLTWWERDAGASEWRMSYTSLGAGYSTIADLCDAIADYTDAA